MSNHTDHITAVDIKQLLGGGALDTDSLMAEVGLPEEAEIDFQSFKSILISELNSPNPNSCSPIGISKQLKRLPSIRIGKEMCCIIYCTTSPSCSHLSSTAFR